MGFYLRKSIKVGPVRFNLSKSGLGVSGGLKGFRVGTGPRGNFIHMGRHGLYYRAALPSGGATAHLAQPPRPVLTPVTEGLTEIESGAVEQMGNSSSEELLDEIRTKRKLLRRWPIALAIGLVVWLVVAAKAPPWATGVVFVVLLAAVVWLARNDALRKTVVLFYQLDHEAETGYQALHDGFRQLGASNGAWHLEAQGATSDWKKNAGAGTLVRRNTVSLRCGNAKDIKTNIAVPVIPVGRQQLHLFPDRILVFDRSAVGVVGYEQLSTSVTRIRFIEDGSVPADAELVGSTWKYVNKRGGPDRRFNNNRQLPILHYYEIHFSSTTGLNETIQVSNAKAVEHFIVGLRSLAEALKGQGSERSEQGDARG